MNDFLKACPAVFVFWMLLVFPGIASGFGAEGHRIAGRVAHTRLCARAELQIEALGGGRRLEELGLWADWIRSADRWSHSGPWHYMNVADDVPLERYRSPREGDVLWAIAHFGGQLADTSLARELRMDALRFLTHFVVDLHQPLHVGRASDRGGNRVQVTVQGAKMNLHRFWDSEAIRLAGFSEDAYVQSALALVEVDGGRWTGGTPLDWARESRNLRPRVYDFGRPGSLLPQAYLESAANITRLRLAQAGVRLASEINRAFCDEPVGSGRELAPAQDTYGRILAE